MQILSVTIQYLYNTPSSREVTYNHLTYHWYALNEVVLAITRKSKVPNAWNLCAIRSTTGDMSLRALDCDLNITTKLYRPLLAASLITMIGLRSHSYSHALVLDVCSQFCVRSTREEYAKLIGWIGAWECASQRVGVVSTFSRRG